MTQSLAILNNPALANLEGLDNLREVGGGITIQANGSLRDLSGLESLASVHFNFLISDNPALTSLRALVKLKSCYGLYVLNNASLPTCEAEALRGKLDSLLYFSIRDNDDLEVCAP